MKAFPPFSLDPVNQCLWRGKERVLLAPKAFDVLRYLVERAGRLVSQEELLNSLWPETYVQPEVLRKYILDIRKALGDQPKDPLFIETIPKRGYQFIAAVNQSVEPLKNFSESAPKDLVGRKMAMAQLEQALGKAVRGQRQIVFVTGEAGIGKTALVDYLERRASGEMRLRFARGQCVEGFGGKEPYYPMLEALGDFARAGGEIIEILAKHAPTWLIQFPALLETGQKEALEREILGATRDRMLREICEALEVISSEAPLILIFEDLHWVDHSTLDLISAVARRRGPSKLLLAATYRPVEVILSRSPLKELKQDLLIHRLCQEISLERLTSEDIVEYLTSRFPQNQFPEEFATLVYRHSDGNPLFMVVILEHMIEKGSLIEEAGSWKLARSLQEIDPGVPETLQQMLDIQFEQLDRTQQRILSIASVAGQRFTEWAASAILDGDASHISECLAVLAAKQQFIRNSGPQQLTEAVLSPSYEFKHALYQEFVYRRLSGLERRQFHRKLAERMEELQSPDSLAPELALHFEEGGEPEQAIRYLILSSKSAARRYARTEIISELRHALELAPSGAVDLELDVRQRIATALYMLGDMAESARSYQETASRAAKEGRIPAQVNALISAARPTAFFDPDGCIAVARQASEVAAAANDPVLLARASLLAARWRIVFNGWSPTDADACANAVQSLRSAPSGTVSAKDFILYPQIRILETQYRCALETAETSLPALAEPESMWEYLAALSAKGLALLGLGELGRALELLLKGIEMSEKNGNAPWIAVFRSMLGYLQYNAFDFEGAANECEEVLRGQSGPHPGPLWTLAMTSAGLAELELGRIEQATERFSKIQNRTSATKIFLDWYWKMLAQFGMTSARLVQGDLKSARQEANDFLEATLACADRSLQSLAWSTKAQVAQMSSDLENAKTCVNHALHALDGLEAPLVAWRVHATAGEFYAHTGDQAAADHHRSTSAKIVLKLADSLDSGEPLRKSLLTRPPMRRLLSELSQ